MDNFLFLWGGGEHIGYKFMWRKHILDNKKWHVTKVREKIPIIIAMVDAGGEIKLTSKIKLRVRAE